MNELVLFHVNPGDLFLQSYAIDVRKKTTTRKLKKHNFNNKVFKLKHTIFKLRDTPITCTTSATATAAAAAAATTTYIFQIL